MPNRLEMNFQNVYSAVSQFPLFAEFKPEEIKALLRIMEFWFYKNREVIFEEGEPGDSCYIIVSGSVGVVKKVTELKDKPVAKMNPGALIGQVALVDRGERSATCISLGDTYLLRLARTAFDALFHTGHPTAYHFQEMLAKIMVQQLRLADEQLAKITNQVKLGAKDAAQGIRMASQAVEEWHEPVKTERDEIPLETIGMKQKVQVIQKDFANWGNANQSHGNKDLKDE